MGIELKMDQLMIPGWALCALVNGDDSGLEQADIQLIDEWEKDLGKYTGGGYYTLNIIDEEPSFVAFPEFGLACDCYTCEVWSSP